ncbi:hypothetical protein LS72_005480 [Helicobacter apodemus]|uniref:Uncharacterized protein n=1 Tax=Helicobacter apodemus TaxID=135569 RepID=A0A4V6I6K8_9HELI|nr:hypothetical protein [Helicobacter apodemus]MDE6959122.1 hypothetical protein [Helicobacter apodemus]TLE15841.1 hypothetical protein LS72_005480 [Helicobacter apodemus]
MLIGGLEKFVGKTQILTQAKVKEVVSISREILTKLETATLSEDIATQSSEEFIVVAQLLEGLHRI